VVVITSNRTREIHDALRRRCFYYWLDYPDAARELEIVRVRVPEAAAGLLRQVVAFVQQLRNVELFKLPGVAESIDWTRALMALGKDELDGATIDETLGVLLKYEDDVGRIRGTQAQATLAEAQRELAVAPSE